MKAVSRCLVFSWDKLDGWAHFFDTAGNRTYSVLFGTMMPRLRFDVCRVSMF